jgi:hypothetical protein
MAGLTADNINDIVKSTLPHLGDGDMTELAPELQDYTAMRIFFSNGMRKKYGSGRKLQWNVLVDANNNTVNHGKMHQFTVSQHDGMAQAEIPWTQTTTHYTWDDTDILENREPAKIVDYLKGKKRASQIGFAEQSEENVWGTPDATDNTFPRTIPFWVYKNATTGFNGGVPSGFSDVAGLSPTTYERHNNYTFLYTDVIEEDFIDSLTTAQRKTGWKAPPGSTKAREHGSTAPDERKYFTNSAMLNQLERFARSNNDNLGAGVLSYMGEVTVSRRPVEYVPYLDADTTNPFYGLHTGTMATAYMADRWGTVLKIDRLPMQPTVGIVYETYMWNLICWNRSRNFVAATAATYPS